VCALLPLVLQVCAVDALEAHVGHTARHDVEASGERDDVVLALLTVGCNDTLFCELLDRGAVFGLRVDVHEADVVTVENLVEVLLEARALDTKGVWRLLREENLILPRVLDTS